MKHLIIAAFLFCGFAVAAQTTLERQVLSSQGQSASTEHIRLNWTLGEPAVSILTTPSGLWTEGFQQPVLRAERIAAPELPATAVVYDIRVMPNPTTALLTVRFPADMEQEELVWDLVDLNGKSLQRQVLPAPSDQDIDLSAYPSGMYLLHFSNRQGQLLQTHRIVKAH